MLPYFFISRTQTDYIIKDITTHPIQIVIGGGCSGKTYVMVDIAWKIRNRDIFLFETKESVTDAAFEALLRKRNCLILTDSNVLSISQIEILFKRYSDLEKNNISIVIFESKNNRDLSGLLKLYEINGSIKRGDIPQVELSNKFSKQELDEINPLLTAVSVGIFSSDSKTIVDSLISASNALREKNKYTNIVPQVGDMRSVAVLISLAIEKKIYSTRVIQFDFLDQIELQKKRTTPLIDVETTWSFEKDFSDNSPSKYVLNAEYWLCACLEEYASDAKSHAVIVEAYRYIVSKLIQQFGAQSLSLSYTNSSPYKDYILFDNINRIFYSHEYGGGLSLIRKIYEGLNEFLSTDPNYMHQRAKCYIKSMLSERNTESKLEYLKKAFRDANVSRQIFETRFFESENEKLLISIAHVNYTQAVIQCHECYINDYSDPIQNQLAAEALNCAMSSPYNSYAYARKDSINRKNVVGSLVNALIADKSLVSEDVYSTLEVLFSIIRQG